MQTLIWLEWRKVVNYIKYSIRSPKRLLLIVLFSAGFLPSIFLTGRTDSFSRGAGFDPTSLPAVPPVVSDVLWLAAFFLSSILIVVWPQSGMNSRFAQLSPSDRDFLLPAPVPGWCILITRGIKATLATTLGAVIFLMYMVFIGRFAKAVQILGYSPLNVIILVVFLASSTAFMATGNSRRNNPTAVLVINSVAWLGSLTIIGLSVQWWPQILDAVKSSKQTQLPEYIGNLPVFWLLAPAQFVADAVSPQARNDLLHPLFALAMLVGIATGLWVYVISTTKRLWDPEYRVSRFRGTFIALSGRSASDTASGTPALSGLRKFRLGAFPDRPFPAILAREVLLAVRRMGGLFALLFILSSLVLITLRYFVAVNLREIQQELQILAVAMVPYGIMMLLVGHSRVTRNRIRTLDQDATLPLSGIDRSAALALGPAIVYLVGILSIVVLFLVFTNSFTSRWLPMYLTGITAFLVLGITISHLALMLYPSSEHIDQMMSIYIAMPLSGIFGAIVIAATLAAGFLGGWVWHAPVACLSISVIVFYILCIWTSRVELDPTSASEE